MKQFNHRLIAALLAGLLCFTALPLTAFAVAEASTEETAAQTEAEIEEEIIVEVTEDASLDVPAETTETETPSGEAPDTDSETEEPPTEDPTETPPAEEPAADPEYRVQVDDVSGYHNQPVTLTLRIEDVGGTGWAKVEASLGRSRMPHCR